MVEAAQARGVQAFIETRILYVHLTQERFEGEDANIYTGTPPLREKRDKDALWKGMADGHIAVLATDHVGYTRADKMHPSVNIVNNRSAGNYLQVNMPLLYSEGVRTKKITLEQMVALTSTNPAKLFGAYPRKGAIAVGSDADLAIWDPNLRGPSPMRSSSRTPSSRSSRDGKSPAGPSSPCVAAKWFGRAER